MFDALDADGGLFLELEQPAHMAPAVVTDAQPPRRRALLHARGDVDGGAADAALGIDAAAEQHAPGVHADAHVEVGHAVLAPHLRRMRLRLLDDGQSGADGGFDVVLAGRLGAEGGEHAVAGVLQHASALGLHRGGEALERAVHDLVDRLGVELLAHGGGADHVDEQHRHLLQLLRRGGDFGCPQRGQLLAQRRQRAVDHHVAEQCTLRLERGDGRGQLLRGLRGHGDRTIRWRCVA